VGAFSTNGKLPKVPANVKLIEGWFEDSLPKFLRNTKGDFGFIHLDADTYDSTKFVLNSIGSRITKGSIIIFDEYIGVPNWQSHEHRAWEEFIAETGITFQYIAFAPQGAMVRVIQRP
jgi:predicted O-methyltransferase YrrM